MSKIEEVVCEKILKRSEVGKSKYGVTMERDDLNLLEWLKHTQEELMDACVYIEKVIQEIGDEKKKKTECKCSNCSCKGRFPKWVRTSSMEEPEEEGCQS